MDYSCKNTYQTHKLTKDSHKTKWDRKQNKKLKTREQSKNSGVATTRRLIVVDRHEEECATMVQCQLRLSVVFYMYIYVIFFFKQLDQLLIQFEFLFSSSSVLMECCKYYSLNLKNCFLFEVPLFIICIVITLVQDVFILLSNN